ncbi:MAG TPA: hypothetical protein VFQ06_04830, partial [Nitrospira sp.]|nr:hypothetical protein [Nitrospira sp.]
MVKVRRRRDAEPKIAAASADEPLRPHEEFEALLADVELRPGKSAAAVAREHGLDVQRLYVLVFFARLWKFDDAHDAAHVALFPRAAKWLRNAGDALRFLADVHLPCFEDMKGASARQHARYAGAPPSELRQPLSHPLEALGPLAEWQVFKSLPMPMEEIQLPTGVLRLPLEPIWLPSFHLP